MKSFEKWETEEVECIFGINLIKNMPLMQDWLRFQQPLTPKEAETAEFYREYLQDFAHF